MFIGFGSLLNASLVLTGSIIGLIAGKRLPEGIITSIRGAIGVFTLLLGIDLINRGDADLIRAFFCLSLGAIVGWFLRRKARFEFSQYEKGFIGASLIFSVGPLTFLGCILEGTKGDSSILISKSLMDGFSAIFLSASLGRGVIVSAGFVLIFQLFLTYLAFVMGQALSERVISRALFVGGGLLILSALDILGLEMKIKPIDMLPGFLMCIIVP
ncbi:MAG: DUF554 family protein [Aquificaceae bacterium]